MRSHRLTLMFALLAPAAACLPLVESAHADAPPDTSVGLPYVHTIRTRPEPACAGPPVQLMLAGEIPACGEVIDSQVFDPAHVGLTLKVGALPDTACPAVFVPWEVSFKLGVLPAGPHVTEIFLVVVSVDSAGNAYRRDFYTQYHTFIVEPTCDTIPQPGPLPYVTRIAIGPDEICNSNLACVGDSIAVRIDGVFPNACFTVDRVDLVPVPQPAFGPPQPPVLRITVDDNACILQICRPQPAPFTVHAKLPPLATPGDYRLEVQLAEVTCQDSFPPGELFRTRVPFRLEYCTPPPPCMIVGFLGAGGDSVCDATVGPGRPAQLRLTVAPTVALAGLQGEIRMEPRGLLVVNLEAVGVARGMVLSWTRTATGARFVLFATSGAPIPSWPPANMDPRGGGYPVLNVTAVKDTDGVIPPRTLVTTGGMLGSDIDGNAVRLCPPLPCVDGGPRDPSIAGAIICAELGCDFNADGFEDVRDLVLMVHCVIGDAPCPPDAGTRFDCDGDRTLGVPDVICCAKHMLQRPSCPACEPDSVRPEPNVAVSFGMPESHGDDIALPVRIDGSGLIGAAMLTLEAPLDRYEVTAFDASPPGRWLPLHQVSGGRLVLGMIDLQNDGPMTPFGPSFTLHFRLRPGQAPGGIVTVTGGEFSGPDGVTLGVDLGRPAQALAGGTTGGLGPNQPNPFSRETAFTLEVAQAGDVTVAIYDLRGRVVTTLHRAPLAAGPHVFRWDGRRSDGGASPNGVYFYQATVAGKSTARKLILMRN